MALDWYVCVKLNYDDVLAKLAVQSCKVMYNEVQKASFSYYGPRL